MQPSKSSADRALAPLSNVISAVVPSSRTFSTWPWKAAAGAGGHGGYGLWRAAAASLELHECRVVFWSRTKVGGEVLPRGVRRQVLDEDCAAICHRTGKGAPRCVCVLCGHCAAPSETRRTLLTGFSMRSDRWVCRKERNKRVKQGSDGFVGINK